MNPQWKRATSPLSYLQELYEYSLRFVRWLASVLKDWRNWLIFGGVYLVFTCPTWLGWLLYFVTGDPWHLTYSTAYMAFWALPLTPLIPLCIAITMGIRKLVHRKKPPR